MNGSILLWVLAATAFFWGVGMYSRITRLRARAIDALGSVGKLLRNYAKLLDVHCAALPAGQGMDLALAREDWFSAWACLVERLSAMELALQQVRAVPLGEEVMKHLSTSYARVVEAWELLEAVPADLAGAVTPVELAQAWEVNAQKVRAATQAFNQLLAKYNEAISQFPAVTLAGYLGFKPAGYL